MSDTVIKVENLSKHYNLGTIGSETLYRDLQSWWARLRGKEDPNTQLGAWDAAQMDQANSFWALKDVSFEVKQGDVVGIIGRNGAGKSTLLKILSRVTGPTSGNIKIKGRVASLLEVGTGFHPELTGRENVYLNGTILGMRKVEIDKKFAEIVAFAEIEKFIDTPVKRYSSGMYVRLAFAVAAHLDPEILIVDEVLAVGDANFQKKCLGKMGEVSKEGRTVLFVSHNMQAVKRLCNKGLFLERGKKIGEGNTENIIKVYLQGDKIERYNLEKAIKNLPPDPVFKLKAVQLKQNDYVVQNNIENGSSLEIIIEYSVLQKVKGFRIYFDILDREEDLIFRSFHDERIKNFSDMEKGDYISTVIIPANILGPINYNLKIYATIFNVRSCASDGIAIPLEVTQTGIYNEAYAADTFRGKLGLALEWNTKKLI
ncbi:ABC transporter ATP-binding protein [Anaerosinus massiliensis]|uniref:ABC transporter ATP-binding protein n=1 Tax=Massilibacillus massiliensis TaxID=1806837 RepID=UPI000DA5EED0|nr:ABC transporter ATP-binding protein [Massilibacillus massiliensis]